MVTVGRLRWLYQHRSFRFGSHGLSHGSDGRRLGHHLRLHHGLTVTLGAQIHGRSAAEEPTHVLAHHGALGGLRGRFLCHTLGGHLEERNEGKNPTRELTSGAQRLHRKMLQKQQHRLKPSDLTHEHGLKYTDEKPERKNASERDEKPTDEGKERMGRSGCCGSLKPGRRRPAGDAV
jgi:hypothetical protein